MAPTRLFRVLAVALVVGTLAAAAGSPAGAATKRPLAACSTVVAEPHGDGMDYERAVTLRCKLPARSLAGATKPYAIVSYRTSAQGAQKQKVYKDDALIIGCAHEGPQLLSFGWTTLPSGATTAWVTLENVDNRCSDYVVGKLAASFYR